MSFCWLGFMEMAEKLVGPMASCILSTTPHFCTPFLLPFLFIPKGKMGRMTSCLLWELGCPWTEPDFHWFLRCFLPWNWPFSSAGQNVAPRPRWICRGGAGARSRLEGQNSSWHWGDSGMPKMNGCDLGSCWPGWSGYSSLLMRAGRCPSRRQGSCSTGGWENHLCSECLLGARCGTLGAWHVLLFSKAVLPNLSLTAIRKGLQWEILVFWFIVQTKATHPVSVLSLCLVWLVNVRWYFQLGWTHQSFIR